MLNALGVAILVATAVPPLLGQSMAGETLLLGLAIFAATQGALHAVLRGIED